MGKRKIFLQKYAIKNAALTVIQDQVLLIF
jgi:hypothetical protein